MRTLTQENIKTKDGEHNNRDFDFEFSSAFGYKKLHETPLFVYADELFDHGMIKPLKLYKHSDSLHKPSRTSSQPKDSKSTVDKSSLSSRSWSPSSNKKWKLTNLLLFRSVSEGHASSRDDQGIKRNETARLVKNDGERQRRKQGRNGHKMAMHYRSNRRRGEEIKRKTFLPYKKTLLGCSDIDPGVYEFCKGQAAVEIKC
ncbi:hypothetical protein DCAR_0624113 [Daucus carota subsp. sativus]|uniref:Uncharacterized protein n=1 Tax=Daucus carota subsp. sativus TaxID=79200 RepID=A0A161XD24_DAUCS|nr:PREDICTED: uncharacterized protein LOC108226052 [Daucus carota subsp. sativus]WOH04701.1 hypothetical protein DCAR_0624113 [Daucus carota subsp. sativus]